MNKCCNGNCNQGRNCPVEQELTKWDWAVLAVSLVGSGIVFCVWIGVVV